MWLDMAPSILLECVGILELVKITKMQKSDHDDGFFGGRSFDV